MTNARRSPARAVRPVLVAPRRDVLASRPRTPGAAYPAYPEAGHSMPSS